MGAFVWTGDEHEARKDQLAIREIVRIQPPDNLAFKVGLAIGTAYHEGTRTALAIGIKFDKEGWCDKLPHEASVEVNFPYVPGLLAYRVGPAVCRLLDECIDEVDLLLFDGQGIAHPRGIGIASHIGALYDKPAIGVTRNSLYGQYMAPPPGRLTYSEIRDPATHALIGYAVSLGENCSPCYVSPGHRFDPQTALKIISQVSRKGDCLPRPLRRAHTAANRWARDYEEQNHHE